MPLYDFHCAECGATQEVLTDSGIRKTLELLCVRCGGVMKAAPVSMFYTISSQRTAAQTSPPKIKPCGHSHHCRCAAIKQRKPNPFQKQLDQALGGDESTP